MGSETLFFSIFLIFATAALLATLALFSRQPLIVVYIVTGIILGPSGLAFIDNHQLISDIAKFGIIFLLFLLGLEMQPAKLMKTLKSATLVGLCSSTIFFVVGLAAATLLGFALIEALIIGVASGIVCFWAATSLKQKLGFDDSLDAFGVHGVGGIVGAFLTGICAQESLGGAGLAAEGLGAQLYGQSMSIVVTLVYSGVLSLILLKIVDAIVGLRVSQEDETRGLDISLHDERGYNL